MPGIESELEGRITRPGELRYAKNHNPYCKFGVSVATKTNAAQYVTVVYFSDRAEVLVNTGMLCKGTSVLVRGLLTLTVGPTCGLHITASDVRFPRG